MNTTRPYRPRRTWGLLVGALALAFLSTARGAEPSVIKLEPMVITDRTAANDEDWPVGELRMIATPETDDKLPVRRVSDRVFFIGWRKSDIGDAAEGLATEVMRLANTFSDNAPEVTAILLKVLPNFTPSEAVPVTVSVASNPKMYSSVTAQTGVILLFHPSFQH